MTTYIIQWPNGKHSSEFETLTKELILRKANTAIGLFTIKYKKNERNAQKEDRQRPERLLQTKQQRSHRRQTKKTNRSDQTDRQSDETIS